MSDPFRHSAIPPFDNSPRPARLGFSMPPEWSPHRATWLSLPHRESSWPGKFEPVPHVFAEMVRLLVPHEEVHINVNGPEAEEAVRVLLDEHGMDRGARVFFHQNPTNDAWCRDHGPCF